MDGFRLNFQDMSGKVKERNDSILGVIRITVWIFWIHEIYFLKTDNLKTYGWILRKFSGYARLSNFSNK